MGLGFNLYIYIHSRSRHMCVGGRWLSEDKTTWVLVQTVLRVYLTRSMLTRQTWL
ncbi:hypothetical protein Hanom_Chr16g01451181 [Helianthus anomalus]